MRNTLSVFMLCAATAAFAQSALPTNQPLVTPQTIESIARSTLTTPQTSYWQGEVFPITHTISVDRRYYQSLSGAYNWPTGAINTEDWPRPTSKEAQGRMTLTQTTRAYSTQGGSVQIPAGSQGIVLISRINESTFGNQNETDTFTLKSTAPQLTFRPLPAPAPTAFAGAIGEFEIASTVATKTARVGEAVSWIVKVSGTGNWPEIRSLPGRAVSKDFDYVKPVLKRNLKPDALFEGDLTEELLLVPTKIGTYQLGPIRFVYFNPKEGKYQMLTSETIELTVSAAAIGDGTTTKSTGAPTERVRVPAAPPTLPLDPLSGQSLGSQPWSSKVLHIACFVAPVLFLLFWFSLAAKRRFITDSLHAKRAARDRVGAAITAIEQGASGEALRFQLHAWQRGVADLGGVTDAMPTPKQISLAIPEVCWGADGGVWAHLWQESNSAIFGQTGVLNSTWIQRAKGAYEAAKLPEVPLGALFLRRNLFPAVAAIALAVMLPLSSQAQTGADAYKAGDFATAEKLWTAEMAKIPTDSTVRYNLSLATAQQDRWSESAAQALAAFCLNPTSPAIRWQLQLSMDRAGIDHPFLAQLSHGTGWAKVARLFSPAGWSFVSVLASIVFSLALAFAMQASFKGKKGAPRLIGFAVAVLAVGVFVSGWISLRGYGELADRDIAVVAQSTLLATVPTEADTGQKTAPLPAGSLAKVDGQFLTWSHLKFSNGQTGWVRTRLITFLYRAPVTAAE